MAGAQRNPKAGERFEDTAVVLPLKGKTRTLFPMAGGFRQGKEQHPQGLLPQGAHPPEEMLGQTGLPVGKNPPKIIPKLGLGQGWGCIGVWGQQSISDIGAIRYQPQDSTGTCLNKKSPSINY